jgi:DNA polymerase I-like protein with 3'-5' exonuclease and polymerase domains
MRKILLVLDPMYKDEPGGRGDHSYVRRLESILSEFQSKAKVYWGKIETRGELDILCKRFDLDAVATTREDILQVLASDPKAKHADYYGSIVDTHGGKEVLILPPLKWLIRVSYGEFYIKRMLSKILTPEKWPEVSPFRYKVLKEQPDFQEFYSRFEVAWLCSIDIETLRPNVIRTVSYTLKFHDGSTETGCFPLKDMNSVAWMRIFNDHPIAKVTQNGKYECAYFAAWGAPMVNWFCDTLNAMHATWSELPKDLSFVSSLFNRRHIYWKDQGEGSMENLLHYNALDTWQTCEAFCNWLHEAPAYARKNYVMKFPQMYLSHEMEMRGLKRDAKRKERWNKVWSRKIAKTQKSLETMANTPGFNANSYKQVRALMKSLTGKEQTASDDKAIKKVMLVHPLNERVLGKILDLRSEIKIQGTYLGIGDKDKDYKGRWLYSINPTGTDTGRDNSSEHHFWCGQNVQNVPNGIWQVKNTIVADKGYTIFEADYSQAEARGVAYSSGDTNLLETVESENDFHSWNASAFFGIPYEEIYDNATGKTLNKPLRNLSKRVNHGTNYNMGAQVLLDTMGEKEVREAQRLLKLPKSYTLLQVTQHLLDTYELTYPRVKTAYYNYIKRQVRTARMLVGATGWTRYCFGDPSSNKLDLNSYVAHVTQSLNAMILDEAARRIFVWRYKQGIANILKLSAKIHDSILFQVRDDYLHLAEEVPKIMMFPVQVPDCSGVVRTMLVPADLKKCGKRWELYQ